MLNKILLTLLIDRVMKRFRHNHGVIKMTPKSCAESQVVIHLTFLSVVV